MPVIAATVPRVRDGQEGDARRREFQSSRRSAVALQSREFVTGPQRKFVPVQLNLRVLERLRGQRVTIRGQWEGNEFRRSAVRVDRHERHAARVAAQAVSVKVQARPGGSGLKDGLALGANQAILTALGNDYGYESVFSRQVEAVARPGDVVWGISTSGNSKNVVEALRTARTLGAWTIGMTGEGGGAIAEYADVLLAVPLSATPRIQEIHVVTYHAICEAVEAAACDATMPAIEVPKRP